MISQRQRGESGCSRAKKGAPDSAHRKVTAWEVPAGPNLTWIMHGHTSHFLRTLHNDYGLYENCRLIPLSRASSA